MILDNNCILNATSKIKARTSPGRRGGGGALAQMQQNSGKLYEIPSKFQYK